MNRVLAAWQQKVNTWQQAVQQATEQHSTESIPAPDPAEFVTQLWNSISTQTGNRNVTVTRGSGAKRTRQRMTVPVYEFDEPWAAPGVIWILNNANVFGQAFPEEEQHLVAYFAEALAKSISRVHYSNPVIREICYTLANNAGVREYDLLQKIYNRNKDNNTRACAAMAMSIMLNNPLISSVEGSEAMARGKRLYYLKQAIILGDAKMPFGNSTLGDMATEQTHRLKYLMPGCIPPQLHLRSTDGQQVTFPTVGKLTLIVFWSPDDPVCSALMESIDQLQKEYPDLEICPVIPFQTPDALQQIMDIPGIAKSYLDNSDGKAGQDYRITSVPTLILTNKRCAIIYNGAPGVPFHTALNAATKATSAPRPKVSIKETEDKPIIQPGSQAKPVEPNPANDQAPQLREMPEF